MNELDVAQLAADAVLVQSLTPRETMGKIYERAAELARLETKISGMESELKRLKDDARLLAQKELPALFDHIQTDRLGVPGWQADVVLESRVHAAIKKEWPDEQQQRALEELVRCGGDTLIKAKVSVEFGQGEFELAADFVRYISVWNRMAGRTITTDKTVHWQTLTKWVSEMRARKVPVNYAALGATFVRQCVIKWRKK